MNGVLRPPFDTLRTGLRTNGSRPLSGCCPLAEVTRRHQADAEKLMTLPGIGPSMADHIIAYRREHGAFTRIDELQKVKGIGPAKFQKLKDKVGL